MERLHKFLAEAGVTSRRGAEELIRRGRVTVDGKTVFDLGRRLDPSVSLVTVDGQRISLVEVKHYYIFYKPAGYLTTLSDPQGRPTIKTFLTNLPVRVYPVGRLDKDVSGLLILTNDGELAKRLMHPFYMVPKVYHARVEGRVGLKALEILRSGQILIDDKKAAPAEATILTQGPDKGWLELTLTEGRHRQVKRMCSFVGHKVIELKRVSYCLINLPPFLTQGQIETLSEEQILILKKKVGLA
ncbi:MAG: rRNA pseudouridine synthase [Deltaproteobacteria bacterium]|jgi:pseudouridine synthase|nr:rRNA pseudouridine synthase [Deltaproteobacteria bacterium]